LARRARVGFSASPSAVIGSLGVRGLVTSVA
jgi:hypothetical protein